MVKEDISLEEIDVYGKKKELYLKNKTLLNNLGIYSRGGSLNQIPSLEMRTYGGYAGVTSASFDGGYARHTKVLYNGIDLTDAMNGQVDLSTLPSFALQSVNYRLNSGTKFGSGSIDGSININNNILNNQNIVEQEDNNLGNNAENNAEVKKILGLNVSSWGLVSAIANFLSVVFQLYKTVKTEKVKSFSIKFITSSGSDRSLNVFVTCVRLLPINFETFS